MSDSRTAAARIGVAIAAAEQMRDEGRDPQHIAAALHYLQQRCMALESLLTVTDRYLRFGLPEHELSQMRLLVGRLREAQLAATDSDEVDATLPI